MKIRYYLSGVSAVFAFAVTQSFAADAVFLKVGSDGAVYRVEERKISLQELGSLAAAEATKDKDITFYIEARSDVPIDAMSKVMDACRKAGVKHFRLRAIDQNKEPNQSPLQTPTDGTPAASAPIAPPSGAAGR